MISFVTVRYDIECDCIASNQDQLSSRNPCKRKHVTGVGKTCLVRQFTQGNLPSGHQGATIGVDFMIKTVEANGMKIKLQLWDTAGQERFRSITQSYYRSAHCLILVYDISSQPSFDALTRWIRDVDAVLDRDTQLGRDVLRVLVGNKNDKEREVPLSIGQKFADLNKFDMFMETSALNNDSVDKLFNDIAEILALRRRDETSAAATATEQTLTRQTDRSSANGLGLVDSINALNLSARARSCLQC